MSAVETLDLVLCDITAESALVIRGAVTPFLEQVEGWEAKVALVDDPKIARASRLVLKGLRCDADKVRKGLKDESLKFGRSVDAAFNKFAALIEPLEDKLSEIERREELAELARRNALEVERTKELAAYEVRLVGLGAMDAETYAQLLFNSRVGWEQKQEAAKKAEADRIAAENSRLVEEARLREENEKLKAAAKVAAAKAKAEREAAEAVAKIERDRLAVIANEQRERAEKARAAAESQANADRIARLEVEAKLKAVADAEAKRVADEAEAQRQAALAPDKEKLLALAAYMRGLEGPTFSTDSGRAVGALLETKLAKLAAWLEQEAQAL